MCPTWRENGGVCSPAMRYRKFGSRRQIVVCTRDNTISRSVSEFFSTSLLAQYMLLSLSISPPFSGWKDATDIKFYLLHEGVKNAKTCWQDQLSMSQPSSTKRMEICVSDMYCSQAGLYTLSSSLSTCLIDIERNNIDILRAIHRLTYSIVFNLEWLRTSVTPRFDGEWWPGCEAKAKELKPRWGGEVWSTKFTHIWCNWVILDSDHESGRRCI